MKKIFEFKASATYPKSEIEGLRPWYRFRVSIYGLLKPEIITVFKGRGKEVFIDVPKETVYFMTTEDLFSKLIPDPYEIGSRLVMELGQHDFRILICERKGKRWRWDYDSSTGDYADESGKVMGDDFADLVDSITDLWALKLVSSEWRKIEKDPGQVAFYFHDANLDPAVKEPGRLVEWLYLLKKGGKLCAVSKQSLPLVFIVPGRIWDRIEKVLKE